MIVSSSILPKIPFTGRTSVKKIFRIGTIIQIQKIQVYKSNFGISYSIILRHPYFPHNQSKILISLISPSLSPIKIQFPIKSEVS